MLDEETVVAVDDETVIRALEQVGFPEPLQVTPVNNLSGGWKMKLALARAMLRKADILLMDEPTNHLDIRSKEVLQEALNLFEGTALIVSHDRSFLDGVVTKVLEISTNKARMLTCNVTEYMERLELEN